MFTAQRYEKTRKVFHLSPLRRYMISYLLYGYYMWTIARCFLRSYICYIIQLNR